MKRVTLEAPLTVAIKVELSPKYIAISLDGGSVHVYNSEGERLHVLRHEDIVWSLAFSSDLLLCGERNGHIRSWDLTTGTRKETFPGHTGTVRSIIFTGPASFVSASRDTTLKTWSLDPARNSEPCTATLNRHTGSVTALAFDAASNLVASTSRDSTCCVWDLTAPAALVCTLAGLGSVVCSIAFVAGASDADLRVVTGEVSGAVKVWNARSGMLSASLDGHTGLVSPILNLADDRDQPGTIATASIDGMIRVWEMSTKPQQLWSQPSAHLGGVSSLDAGGEYLFSGGISGEVKVWERKTGHLVQTSVESRDAVYRVASKQGGGNGFVVVSWQNARIVMEVSWDPASIWTPPLALTPVQDLLDRMSGTSSSGETWPRRQTTIHSLLAGTLNLDPLYGETRRTCSPLDQAD